jgi:tRNA 2-thiouridine synthesizing protein C
MKQFLIITQSAPYGSSRAKEATDLALATALFDQQVSMLFMGDGVYQLIANQNPQAIEQKSLGAMQQALPLYDVEALYVCAESLKSRGLSADELAVSVTPLSGSEITTLFKEQEHIFNV